MVVTSKWQDVKFTYCRCFFLKAVLIPRWFRNKSDYFWNIALFPPNVAVLVSQLLLLFHNLPRGQFWSFFTEARTTICALGAVLVTDLTFSQLPATIHTPGTVLVATITGGGWAWLLERNRIWLTADFHLRCRLLDQQGSGKFVNFVEFIFPPFNQESLKEKSVLYSKSRLPCLELIWQNRGIRIKRKHCDTITMISLQGRILIILRGILSQQLIEDHFMAGKFTSWLKP